jgi:hypothetical protein
VSSYAHAAQAEGYQASFGFFPMGRLIKKTAETNQSALTGDFYLGYVNSGNTTYGLLVNLQQEESTQSGFSNPSDNQKISRQRTSIGAALGHKFDSFYVRVGVYGYSRWTDTFNTIVTTYSKGIGVQLDIGVPIMIGTSFFFAPQFTVQSFQYQSSESGGETSTLNPPMTDTIFSPYLVFGFMI